MIWLIPVAYITLCALALAFVHGATSRPRPDAHQRTGDDVV